MGFKNDTKSNQTTIGACHRNERFLNFNCRYDFLLLAISRELAHDLNQFVRETDDQLASAIDSHFFCFELENSCRKFRKFCFFVSITNFVRSFIKTTCVRTQRQKEIFRCLVCCGLCLSVSISLLMALRNKS